MRRWDRLVERFVEEYVSAGRAEDTIRSTRRELERLGSWLKCRRPRPSLDEVGSDLLIQYLQSRSAFHCKSTLSTLMSKVRCFGEFLIREGVWSGNPLRWMRGPRLDPRGRLPRRISEAVLKEVFETATTNRYGYHRWAWMTLLGVFYGTGARRGEISRLDLCDWNRDEGLLLRRALAAPRLSCGRRSGLPSSGPRPSISASRPFHACLRGCGAWETNTT